MTNKNTVGGNANAAPLMIERVSAWHSVKTGEAQTKGWKIVKVCVVGLGYIGFPTACVLAGSGHDVIGVDVDETVVSRLSKGQVHIVNEDGLVELASQVMQAGRLRVSTRPEPADAFIICVPTPFHEQECVRDAHVEVSSSSGQSFLDACSWPVADLSYVIEATRSILPFVVPGNLVVLESTVPPGTTEGVVLRVLEEHGFDRTTIHVAHAPERVLPGAILKEIRQNDRVIGGVTSLAAQLAKELYATFVTGTIFTTDAATAEMAKLMENTYRDVNIALANEFARVADRLGINVQEAIAIANRHPRVNILSPGPGVGGHCIPVDPYFIIQQAPEETPLMQVARAVNRGMPKYVADLVDELASAYGVTRITILGAAYKPDVSDFRESPAFEIQDELIRRGYSVQLHDPFREDLNRPMEEACAGADLLLVATDHTLYKRLSPDTVSRVVSKKILLDTRLTMPADLWEEAGFVVRRLGDGRRRVVRSVSF